MNVAADERALVVSDTSVLLNFAMIDCLPLLTESRWDVYVPNHVVREVRSEESRARVARALEQGTLTEIEISELAEIELYGEYRRRFGDGESAALAVGVHRRWAVAIDEKGPSRREVIQRLGEDYLLTAQVIMGVAVGDGLLEPQEIPGIRTRLAANRYASGPMSGESAL